MPDASVTGALSRVRLFVNQGSPAARQADAWKSSRPADAAKMRYIAQQPVATWLGNWTSNVRNAVNGLVSQASSQGAVPVLVAYDIPDRDCGSYSAGGAGDAATYSKWIRDFANGLSGRKAIVVLEPDAVAQSSCLSSAARDVRFSMLRNAVSTLKQAGAYVYLDAGNAHWVSATEMASRLRQAGIEQADGFSLNVSNFFSTADNVAYGNSLSRLLGGKHYVIDTGRNGVGGTADRQWCNPGGQALGVAPTTQTGMSSVDAFLWIKQPGESDGTCNGGPKAGQWWPEYALGLAQRITQLASAN
ncbi:MAG TPA: glycoside hydrolase family 6 protein [Gemmatimonadaceae bacterium]|nr:glycoside hydrolase family 6 protein [Gemmatimonadaceae bacterium]